MQKTQSRKPAKWRVFCISGLLRFDFLPHIIVNGIRLITGILNNLTVGEGGNIREQGFVVLYIIIQKLVSALVRCGTVSYTHLDVYKRQAVQLAACIPNFAIQEYSNIEGDDFVKKPIELKDGYLIVPDTPGIGVELQEDVEKRRPYQMRQLRTKLNVDGAVVDR